MFAPFVLLSTGLAPKPGASLLSAQTAVGVPITATTGVTFTYYNYRLTWPEAAAFCADHHNKLAVVMNPDDNALLADVIAAAASDARGTWLGATALNVTHPTFAHTAKAYRMVGNDRQHSTDLKNWFWYPEDNLGSLADRRANGAWDNWAPREPNNGGGANPGKEFCVRSRRDSHQPLTASHTSFPARMDPRGVYCSRFADVHLEPAASEGVQVE